MSTGMRLNRLWLNTGMTLEAMLRRSLIGAGLLAVALAVGVQFAQVYDLRMDSYARRLRVAAQLCAEQVAQVVEHYQAALVLSPGEVTAGGDWPSAVSRLKEQFPALETLVVADRGGRVSHALPYAPSDSGVRRDGGGAGGIEPSATPVPTDKRSVTGVFAAGTTGAASFALGVPFFDPDGQVAGVVEGVVSATDLGRVDGIALKERGFLLLIVDRDDRVVYASDALTVRAMEKWITPVPQRSERAAMVDGLLGDGSSAYVATAETPFGWTVMVIHPASIVRGELRRDLVAMLAPALLVMAAIAWVASRLARRLSAPIRELSGRMKGYPSNAGPIEVDAVPSEIEELGRAFNSLTSRVNRARDEARRAEEALMRTLRDRDETILARTAELQRLNDELRRACLTDALTGCRNYRALTEDAARVGRRCADEDAPLGIIACDIDMFKQYNDRYGHPAGDVCLQRVAGALRSALFSAGDVLARAGGEEFVALLPRLSEKATRKVAERMRVSVAGLGIPHADSPLGVVTVSVGWCVHASADDAGLETAMAAADAALYLAKEQGRNCVAGADAIGACMSEASAGPGPERPEECRGSGDQDGMKQQRWHAE